MMAMFLFLGIYIFNSGARGSGAATIALASLFLINAEGKSSFALFFTVMVLTSLTTIVRSLWLRAVIFLAPLLVLNLLSVGTVMNESLANIAKLLPFDTEFHRPHRYLDIRVSGAAIAAADRIRLFGFLGLQFDPGSSARHGMGRVCLAQS